MKKFFEKLKSLIPTKRRLIQLYCALLFNANIKGYLTGTIYQGAMKNVCTPGLNCYSCPGAATACPLGALQNAFASSGKRTPYYVIGIILLYGIILGRTICGFLCPFGLFQDLLHKIPTPKLKKNKFTKVLSYLKYVILVLFVVIFPLMYVFRDFPLPAFCKYICPAGTIGGAFGLLANSLNDGMFEMLGPLFTWKFVLAVGFILACIFIYRFFCRFFCPLGALYGLFNKFAILGIKLDKPSCTSCGRCMSTCKMDISEVGDKECISCGDCVDVCPTGAIQYRGGKIILPPNEIPENATDEEKEKITKKRKTRVTVVKIVAAILAVLLLGGALVYYNFIDQTATVDPGNEGEGNEVGDTIIDYELRLFEEGETLKISDLRGKTVVINFWGTWCSGCKKELPDFSRVAAEYKDKDVVIIAIHTTLEDGDPYEYVDANFPTTDMIFAFDDLLDESTNADKYYTALGGKGAYPMTFIVDSEGVITYSTMKEMTYDDLKAEVEAALGSTRE